MAEDDEQEQAARDDFPDVPRRGGGTPRRPSADDDYGDRDRSSGSRSRGRPQTSALEMALSSPATKQFARTLARGLVGALLGGRRRR
jgi:hypothetical protein